MRGLQAPAPRSPRAEPLKHEEPRTFSGGALRAAAEPGPAGDGGGARGPCGPRARHAL